MSATDAGTAPARGHAGRRAALALLWTVVLVASALAANAVGIVLFGSIDAWQRWLENAAGYFLIWRLCLYGATVWGWAWMRRRLLMRDADPNARRRLMHSEVAAALAVVALEASVLLRG